MAQAPALLNDDGTASIATAFMSSHHAFRRDLARFASALAKLSRDAGRARAIGEEWTQYRGALHGHHQVEDTGIFPGLRQQSASLAATLERLEADHRRIDPLLEEGDRAFADLPRAIEAATRVVGELRALLDEHLAVEEAEVVPFLRGTATFPPPATPAEAELYASGFAWSTHGIAEDVIAQLDKMLPEILRSKLPAARAAYAARCERAFGTLKPGAARTPIPDEGA